MTPKLWLSLQYVLHLVLYNVRWCFSHSLTKAYPNNHGFFPLFPMVGIHGRGYMLQDVILVVVSVNEI